MGRYLEVEFSSGLRPLPDLTDLGEAAAVSQSERTFAVIRLDSFFVSCFPTIFFTPGYQEKQEGKVVGA